MENSLQLFAAVETRFCSQVYSSERFLADKQFIREIFSSVALINYLANAQPELRSEYEKLDIDLVSNASSWARIQTFVAVEIPVRKLLRMSDGHTPNLPQMCHGFKNAQKESLEAVQAATLKFTEIYRNLQWIGRESNYSIQQKKEGHCYSSMLGSIHGSTISCLRCCQRGLQSTWW